MIQCKDCEHCQIAATGVVTLKCNPFTNIKEPECLQKLQILRLAELTQKVDRVVTAYETTAAMYKRFAPLQEKMFRHMEREIDEADEAERWKAGDDDEGPDDEEDRESWR